MSNAFPLRTFRAAAIAGARDRRHLCVVVLAGVAAATPPCSTATVTCRDDLTPFLDDATPDARPLLVWCASRGCGVDPVPPLWLASLERAVATSARLVSDGCREDVEAVDLGLETPGAGRARVHVGDGAPDLGLDAGAMDWTTT